MKIRNLVILVLIVVIIGFGIFYLINNAESCKTTKASRMNIQGHNELVQHIHTKLEISILGLEQPIPPNVGRESSRFMRPLHIHDTTGKIHVESYCLREFKLGEFFEIWGREFNENCIFEHCNSDNNSLKMYVNDKQNFEFGNLSLKDSDVVRIVYE